jgi:hypothetical protein
MLHLILLIVVLGVCLWLVEQYVPMSPPLKVLLRVVIVIGVVLYLLSFLGVAGVPVFR